MLFEFTLPDCYEVPAFRFESGHDLAVTFFVFAYFLKPEGCVCFGNDKILTALVPVPETAIYENHCLVLRKHNIWFPGDVFGV